MGEKGKNYSLPAEEMAVIKKIFQEDNELGLSQDDVLFLRDIIWDEIIDPESENVTSPGNDFVNVADNKKIKIPENTTIAEVFRNARSGCNLNQREFAKLLGITQATLCLIETGSNLKPTKRILQSILPYSPYGASDIFRLAGYDTDTINDLESFEKSHKVSGRRIILRVLVERLEEKNLDEVIEGILAILKGETWYEPNKITESESLL